VAIDGPAGAGKSTVARNLATALGYVLVDTGAIYRAVALAAARTGVPLGDGAAVTALAEALLARSALVFQRDASLGMRVLLEGEDVSDAIRSPEVGLGASEVSVHPGVRAALLELQRGAGREGGVVLEGRDIGTVVFPHAEEKFFLTASAEVRATWPWRAGWPRRHRIRRCRPCCSCTGKSWALTCRGSTAWCEPSGRRACRWCCRATRCTAFSSGCREFMGCSRVCFTAVACA